ncbi:XdhC/CoxI family protein [Paenibacillus sp. LMG 31456]|uniref:XdhC/CoxI family protein n=1 Tax=Paenibacillus foliorum TaxID=2654974 RepID=A0A972GPU6_9BACL|nr:XdhC/CoxI family protein [Paenibacillus foliorum]NOU92204.1 XdhC/CoxI family protein [Paenibacillus foliorum]
MDLHELLNYWDREKLARKAALATIVKVSGHAYRKIGASMLLFEDGERVGGISPGCLEADLQERVTGVLEHGRALYVEYDMRNPDDFAWGEAIGCGGSVHVLVEPLTEKLDLVLTEVKAMLDLGQVCLLSREWDAEGCVSYKVESAVMHGLQAAAGRTSLQFYCEPRPRLVVFGAGTDAQPLVELSRQAGFRVVVADWREALCCSGSFPEGCETAVGSPNDLIERLQISEVDYVVIMSHQLERDRQCLEALWSLSPRYVGLLGSKTRSAQVLNGRTPPVWLRCPVGLPIRAEGPFEIAVSIVAELIAVKRNAVNSGRGVNAHGNQSDGSVYGSWTKPAYGSPQAFHTARQ